MYVSRAYTLETCFTFGNFTLKRAKWGGCGGGGVSPLPTSTLLPPRKLIPQHSGAGGVFPAGPLLNYIVFRGVKLALVPLDFI